MDLLDYYSGNLRYIRALAAEFAGEFPKIAGRLALSDSEYRDPFVERLLEGTAFLAAKVEKELDEGYFAFLESTLNAVAPDALFPSPSGAVIEPVLTAVKQDAVFPAKTYFDAAIPGANAPCRFASAVEVPVSPLVLRDAEYNAHLAEESFARNTNAVSSLILTFSLSYPSGETPLPENLQLYFNMNADAVSQLQRQLLCDTLAVNLRQDGGDWKQIWGAENQDDVHFSIPLHFDIFEEFKVSGGARGLRILRNFLSYPDFFKFFTIRGLHAFIEKKTRVFELAFLFKRREITLEQDVKKKSIKLNCIPVLNVFDKRSNRIAFEKERYEFHIIPDKTALRDYEVLSVKKIDFFNEKNEAVFSATNFYGGASGSEKSEKNVFFNQTRKKRLINGKSKQRSGYAGAEMFVSFSSGGEELENASQFAADTLCTNRDLTVLTQAGAELVCNSPLAQKAVFVSPPTFPKESPVDRGGRTDFARLSHIVFNLSAMLWQENGRSLEIFKTMIRNYPLRSAEEMERIINGIVGLSAETKIFRFIEKGAVFFEPGWKILLTLDEAFFTGMNCYGFACICKEILASFAPLNTLLEIHFATVQSGVIDVWKT